MAEDGRRARSVPALVEVIRDEIVTSPLGRITFARFMQRALTEPGLGYYATSERRPTREGDFLTAPELHPLFGACIGGLIEGLRDETLRDGRAGSGGASFRVLEYGAGRGTLRATATEHLDFPLEWARADMPDRSDPPSAQVDLVLANEYLDALPVHRLVRAGGLREAWVGWQDDWFTEVVAEPSSPALAEHLAADGVELREGQRAEVCLEAPRWLAAQASELTAGGVVLVIDYGHEAAELYGPRRMAGSLLTYRDHAVGADPFDAVGRSDITAHLDVTALARAANEAGLARLGSTALGPFLATLGLGERLARLGQEPGTDPAVYLEARAAAARLLDPRHLGAFRVLAWARPDRDGRVPALPGMGD